MMGAVDIQLDSEDSMGDEEKVQNSKNLKPARLRRSCELCRTHKARCIAGPAGSDGCQRCTKNGNKCIFLAAKARPKKALTSKARVEEMEQRLDDLMAMLQNRNQLQNPTPELTPTPVSQLRSPSSDSMLDSPFSETYPSTLMLQKAIGLAPQLSEMCKSPDADVNDSKDLISKGIVTVEQATEYLNLFRLKISCFPFVVVSSETSLDELRAKKPFLLLAILAFGSAQSYNLQTKVIETELLEILGRRNTSKGEKSLDLLQGLMIYVSSYQYFFNPKGQQIYQFSQMIVVMAIELGIHRPSHSSPSINLNFVDLITPPMFAYKVSPEDLEAKRTFLGAYYLSSAVAHSTRKPNIIRHSTYIGECCSFLCNSRIEKNDHLLQYFVRLQYLQEQINTAFDYDAQYDLQILDTSRIEILLNTFNSQLQHFQGSFPSEVWENKQITMTFYTMKIYLNEIAFHTTSQSLLNAPDWYNSTTRTSTLLTCLQNTKTYLDFVLDLPMPVFLSLTMPDFTRLIYALLVLGCFATPTNHLSSTLCNFQDLARLEQYLDRFTKKTGELLATGTAPGYLFHFNFLFKDINEWFARTMDASGAKGKCLTDLVGDMFPAGMKQVARPLITQYDDPFNIGETSGIGECVGPIQELWDDLDGLDAMWSSEMGLEVEMMIS